VCLSYQIQNRLFYKPKQTFLQTKAEFLKSKTGTLFILTAPDTIGITRYFIFLHLNLNLNTKPKNGHLKKTGILFILTAPDTIGIIRSTVSITFVINLVSTKFNCCFKYLAIFSLIYSHQLGLKHKIKRKSK